MDDTMALRAQLSLDAGAHDLDLSRVWRQLAELSPVKGGARMPRSARSIDRGRGAAPRDVGACSWGGPTAPGTTGTAGPRVAGGGAPPAPRAVPTRFSASGI